MILYTSAIIAILAEESTAVDLLRRLVEASVRAVGAPTLVETAMVLSRVSGIDSRQELKEFLSKHKVKVLPFGQEHFDLAADAFYRFGKGRHPARLNFGDCMSYAAARQAGLPLLYVGNDFAQTDVNA